MNFLHTYDGKDDYYTVTLERTGRIWYYRRVFNSMSCDKNGRKCIDAARRNGIHGQVSRYLNTLGSWSTYRDLTSLEEVPERVAQLTGAFFGVKGLVEGHPRLAGILGAIIAIHALEYATAGAATTITRLYGRGRPLVFYGGVTVRDSPGFAKKAGFINRLTGGWVLDARGCRFSEAGRTWSCQSITLEIGDGPRTLTRIQSYSLPQREFYFDRPVYVPGAGPEPAEGTRYVAIQRVIDLVRGNDSPDSIPGFIGQINEFENAVGLGAVKRAFFGLNWLTVDEGERDGGAFDSVDYDALVKGLPPGSPIQSGGYYQVSRGTTVPVSSSPGSGGWPSTTRPATSSPVGYGASLFGARPAAVRVTPGPAAQTPGGIPLDSVKARIVIDGKEYPLIVKRIMKNPISGVLRADAVYFDESTKQWREVAEAADRESLAQAVAEGRLAVTAPEDWPAHKIYY